MATKNKLIEARKRKGYKQEYLANVIGKDGSCYCRKEKYADLRVRTSRF